MRLLLVEDDQDLAAVLLGGFRENDIEVAHAADVDTALERALRGQFEVIILDVMLRGGSGFDLCEDLRQRGITTPLLMLTARDTVDDRVRGLDVGADDYLTKPFAFRELLARIRALARRRPALVAQVVSLADFTADLQTRRVSRGSATIELTAKEFALLEVLVAHQDTVIDRATITAHVWDENHDPFTNVLEVLIRRLRRKIDDGFTPRLIHTLRGAGYRFGV